MNAARQEPQTRLNPTHTFWPAGRRPAALDPASASASPASPTEKKDEERPAEEPGYGHGV